MSKSFAVWPLKAKTNITFPALRLASERLVLRPPHSSDCEDWIALRRRSRDHLTPFEPAWPAKALTSEFFINRIANQARDWKQGQSCSFFIFQQPRNILIGSVNLNNIVRGAGQYATLGYWLGEEFQGQGYMHEALRQTMIYGFTAQNLHRINAATLPHNGRSMKLLRRLGFEEEGFAKSYLQINGEWQDHILFGITEDLFKKKSGIIV